MKLSNKLLVDLESSDFLKVSAIVALFVVPGAVVVIAPVVIILEFGAFKFVKVFISIV